VGDCLHFADGKYKGEDCDEQRADSKVYAAKSDADDCVDVPGTSSTYYEPTSKGGRNWYCIGDKDLDLTKAINGINTDECIVVNGSAAAEKSPCDASGSRPVMNASARVRRVRSSRTVGASRMRVRTRSNHCHGTACSASAAKPDVLTCCA
jgi:hypothetical protein